MYRPTFQPDGINGLSGKVYLYKQEGVVDWRWHRFLVGWFLGTLVVGIGLVITTFF